MNAGAKMGVQLVYVTTRDRAEAVSIGRSVVESHLAACVNIIDGMNSIYFWDGAMRQDQETVLIAKTTDYRLQELIAAIRAKHSYDCPCIVSLPVEQGNPDYLEWIADQVRI